MAECRITESRTITQPLGRPMMRLINRKAHAIGGPTYFQDCRAYVLQKVDRELRRQNATLSVQWLEGVLLAASLDDMLKLRAEQL